MRRDGGRPRHATTARSVERRRVAGRAARALRWRRARGRVAPPPRARRAGDPRGARRGRRDRRTSTPSPSPPSPGLIGALLVGVSAAKALAWSRRLPLIPVDHLHGHVASLYLRPLDLEPPFTCLLASGGHTMLLDVQERGGVPRARDDARRRGRRGLRQGRAAARARLPRAGRRSTRSRPSGDPSAYSFPVARAAGPRLLVLRPQDGAALRRARPAAGRARGAARRSRRLLPARDRAGARRAARGDRAPSGSPSSAESRRTRSYGRRCRTPRWRRSRSAPTTRR